jgi:hypothetical protein
MRNVLLIVVGMLLGAGATLGPHIGAQAPAKNSQKVEPDDKTLDWVCPIYPMQTQLGYTTYYSQDCDTGQYGPFYGDSGLPQGLCSDGSHTNCFQIPARKKGAETERVQPLVKGKKFKHCLPAKLKADELPALNMKIISSIRTEVADVKLPDGSKNTTATIRLLLTYVEPRLIVGGDMIPSAYIATGFEIDNSTDPKVKTTAAIGKNQFLHWTGDVATIQVGSVNYQVVFSENTLPKPLASNTRQ